MATPLGKYRMLDLSRQLPGPFCSTMLGDLGMDVLTIAAPTDPFGVGISFLARNKRSMTLNLKSNEGREILLRLVDESDVLLEGFRPGVMARLGIDYATLAARNPRLVYCSITGYGQDGPYASKVGHDVNYLGYGGVLNFIGEQDQPPVIPGVQIADIGGGSLMAVIGILTALLARDATGRGQAVDIGMLDGAVAWNVYHMLLYQVSGRLPGRGTGQMTGRHACYAVYRTSDDRYLTIGAYEGHFWAVLCRHFAREDFVEQQWADGEKRVEMLEFFRAAFRTKTLAAWMGELGALDICVGPVSTLDDVYADPQVRHRGMILEVDGPAGKQRMPASPIKLSDTPPSVRTPPPVFGGDTDAVLARLGFDAAQAARLRGEGIV